MALGHCCWPWVAPGDPMVALGGPLVAVGGFWWPLEDPWWPWVAPVGPECPWEDPLWPWDIVVRHGWLLVAFGRPLVALGGSWMPPCCPWVVSDGPKMTLGGPTVAPIGLGRLLVTPWWPLEDHW